MEATQAAMMPERTRRIRMAGDLLWFASASLGAGLLASIAAAAVVILLAQPIYANETVYVNETMGQNTVEATTTSQ